MQVLEVRGGGGVGNGLFILAITANIGALRICAIVISDERRAKGNDFFCTAKTFLASPPRSLLSSVDPPWWVFCITIMSNILKDKLAKLDSQVEAYAESSFLVGDELEKVKEKYHREQEFKILMGESKKVLDGEQPPHPAGVIPKNEKIGKFYSGEGLLEKYKKMEDDFEGGLMSGYPKLDEYFTYVPGHLYVLSGTTHTGKTTFTTNIAYNMASRGKKVVIASLEMGLFVVKQLKLFGPNIPKTLAIYDTTRMVKLEEMERDIYDLPNQPDILFIDHIHFIKKDGENTTAEIEAIVQQMQYMAKRLNIPVVLVAHTKKLNKDRPPTLDDLKDTVSLSQVPSVVVQLYRKRKKIEEDDLGDIGVMDDLTYVLIQKNRIKGKLGYTKYRLDDQERLSFNNTFRIPLPPDESVEPF